MQHVFLVGAKSLGAYGGYETFINKLTEYHQSNPDIKYHVAVKANGQGASVPDGVEVVNGRYTYHNADCLLSGKLNDAPSGRLFRADFRTLQMCQSL